MLHKIANPLLPQYSLLFCLAFLKSSDIFYIGYVFYAFILFINPPYSTRVLAP